MMGEKSGAQGQLFYQFNLFEIDGQGASHAFGVRQPLNAET